MNVRRLYDDFLSRERAWDKHHLLFKIADSFPIDAEPLNRQRKLLPLLDRNCLLRHMHATPLFNASP